MHAQNPYECAQEELFINSSAVRENHESDDCGVAVEVINRFHQANAKGDVQEKFNLLKSISFFRCQETFNFLENQINNSFSETDRCNAILNLAWMLEPDYLPLIQQYAEKSSLTVPEKSAVATALMIYGTNDSLPRLVTQSLQILDEICRDTSLYVLENCILSYCMEGGSAAKSFFYTQLQQEESKLYAAVFLARLGEHKTTFPIFENALSSDDNNEIHLAIMGLAMMGTEEAIQLILSLANNLPSVVRATKKITAGNAAVKVLSGQNVTFLTAGEIRLLPGFEAAAGSNFNTQIKNSSTDVTAMCNRFCGYGTYPGFLIKYQDHFCAYNIVNIDKISFEVYAFYTGQLLKKGVVNVTKNGTVCLWDLNGSGGSSVLCVAYITLYMCFGSKYPYKTFFVIYDGGKSFNENNKESENPETYLSLPPNNITLQDENPVPNFSIIPNPNPGIFQIEINFSLSDIANLKITNSLGATVYETQNLFSNTIQLPTSTSGLHFVVVMLKDGTVLTQKMMLQR